MNLSSILHRNKNKQTNLFLVPHSYFSVFPFLILARGWGGGGIWSMRGSIKFCHCLEISTFLEDLISIISLRKGGIHQQSVVKILLSKDSAQDTQTLYWLYQSKGGLPCQFQMLYCLALRKQDATVDCRPLIKTQEYR